MRRVQVYLVAMVVLVIAITAGWLAADWPRWCRELGWCSASFPQ